MALGGGKRRMIKYAVTGINTPRSKPRNAVLFIPTCFTDGIRIAQNTNKNAVKKEKRSAKPEIKKDRRKGMRRSISFVLRKY